MMVGSIPMLLAISSGAGEAQATKGREKKDGDAVKPPWQRVLKGDDARKVEAHEQEIAELEQKGKFADAVTPAREVLAIRSRVQGEDHWETVTARIRAQTDARVADLPGEAQSEVATAIRQTETAEELYKRGHNAEAHPLYEQALAIRRKSLGEDHPDTAESSDRVAFNLNAQGSYAEAQPLFERALAIRRKSLGEDHPDTARGYNNVAFNLDAQGHYAEAQPLHQRALAIRRTALGEDHPSTAQSYNNVAYNLKEQGRYGEAQPLYERGLEIWRTALGEDHTETARGYNNVAVNLADQGRYAEAQPLYERSLAIWRTALGEDHPSTAQSTNNVAHNLHAQGRYAEAQPLLERALAIRRRALGEDHALTAQSYLGVAFNLHAQGRYAEAQPLFERALAIRRKALGEDHPDMADSYNSVAFNLQAQGRHAEVQPPLERALAIRRKTVGEDHPSTAESYNNVAFDLDAQGRYVEAQPQHERALAIWRKALGEDHPYTAIGYNGLAVNLAEQGRYAEAQPLHQRALAIRRKALGEDHPLTARSDNNVAANLQAQGRYAEAEKHWTRAAVAFEKLRGRIAFTGLDRAGTAATISPFAPLACMLAHRGAMTEAWNRYEQNLARGLLDDLSARQARRISDKDRRREQQLFAQLKRLDTRAERLAANPQQVAARDHLTQERLEAQADWSAFQQHLQDTYGVAEGRVFDLDHIQGRLPADAALVGWLDLQTQSQAAETRGDHWACVVRRGGAPRWIRIFGTGPNQSWTRADDDRPGLVRKIVSEGLLPGWQEPLAELAEQRLGPLDALLQAHDHLPPVQHLIVLPSTALAGIPVEALLEARPASSPRYLVSYAPSGTMFAWLQERRRADPDQPAQARRLLALGDPVPPPSDQPSQPAPKPPDHGLLVRVVQPGSNAARAGIQPGDVLLAYAGTKLATRDDLTKQVQAADPKGTGIAIAVWRHSKTLDLTLKPGLLGVQLATGPAAEVILAQRDGDALLRRTRGSAFTRLPGTRREVQAIADLFTLKDVFLGSDASEQLLDDLRAHDQLKQFDVIHLAAHGKMDDLIPMNSRLLLSQDRLPDPLASSSLDQPYSDGAVTAGEVMSTWKLDADLVVLSACQSGLGRSSGGEGFVGFAQALFLAGGRSLILSLWEVDDRATALLMTRFYQNWLGKRPGLARPLPKAEALREAKQWLRALTSDELESALEQISRGIPRPKAGKPVAGRPFEHPHYWAGFILMGDPR
jgi:CHAT domain-containing protein/tetratricopeptide (TPR) repeat protein